MNDIGPEAVTPDAASFAERALTLAQEAPSLSSPLHQERQDSPQDSPYVCRRGACIDQSCT